MKLILLLKAKKAQVGEIRSWKGGRYQKQSNGKWMPVKKQISKKDTKDDIPTAKKLVYFADKKSGGKTKNNQWVRIEYKGKIIDVMQSRNNSPRFRVLDLKTAKTANLTTDKNEKLVLEQKTKEQEAFDKIEQVLTYVDRGYAKAKDVLPKINKLASSLAKMDIRSRVLFDKLYTHDYISTNAKPEVTATMKGMSKNYPEVQRHIY